MRKGERGGYHLFLLFILLFITLLQNHYVQWFFARQQFSKKVKSFGPCQPAQTAQDDMGQYFSQIHYAPLFTEQMLIYMHKSLDLKCIDVGVQNSFNNPLPDMPILGSSNSAANKDMMSKILTNGDAIFWLSRKHCGTRGPWWSYIAHLSTKQCRLTMKINTK